MSEPLQPSADLLNFKLDALAANVGAIQLTVSEMSKTLITLVRVEERQIDSDESLKRAFKQIDGHETRLQALEQKMPGLVEMRAWALAGITSVLGFLAWAVLSGHFR